MEVSRGAQEKGAQRPAGLMVLQQGPTRLDTPH